MIGKMLSVGQTTTPGYPKSSTADKSPLVGKTTLDGVRSGQVLLGTPGGGQSMVTQAPTHMAPVSSVTQSRCKVCMEEVELVAKAQRNGYKGRRVQRCPGHAVGWLHTRPGHANLPLQSVRKGLLGTGLRDGGGEGPLVKGT